MALSIFNIKHMYWEDDNTTSVDYYELIADTMSDVPQDMYYFSTEKDRYKMAQGSMVYVVSDGTVYMCDSTGTWIEQESGGGGATTLIEKSISANGVYNASDDSADGYSKVTVDVPNTYTAQDEGKVVDNGALVAQTAMSSEVTENGTVDTTLYNSVTVNVPSGGGGSQPRKDVNFYDYDGTIVNSYTAAEFAELSAMPDNPTHDGLTAQGWNWSLADAKSYVADYGKLNIGQMYVTSDGKTRVHINLIDNYTSPTLELYLEANSEVDIDWGDGSTHSTFVSTTAIFVNELHSYSTSGDYTIIINVISGDIRPNGNGQPLLKGSNTETNRIYRESLYNIEIGNSVTSIGTYAFNSCYSLTTITIPNSVTSIDNNAFNDCSSLSSITIPNGVTSIGTYAFIHCNSLTSVTIPNSVTSIGTYAFQNCSSLSSITIPNGVTSIGTYAFQNCSSLSSITIPDGVTSIGDSAFNGCSSLSSITIPDGVTSIGGSAFYNCYSLLNIYVANALIPTGSPWGAPNSHVNVVATRHNNYQSSCTEVASGTILTGTIDATVGDLIVATFENLGGEYTLPSGWILLGDSGAVEISSWTQRTGMAYKIAESTTESFILTQASSGRMFINLIAITGASIGTFSGFTKNETNNTITATKPQGLTIWAVSTLWWGSTWDASPLNNKSKVSKNRCENFLDQSDDTAVTFTTNTTQPAGGLACASLTITGIDNFWYYDD